MVDKEDIENKSRAETENKIKELKCEIFDIIAQQEGLNLQINQLNETKFKKVQELQKLTDVK